MSPSTDSNKHVYRPSISYYNTSSCFYFSSFCVTYTSAYTDTWNNCYSCF